MSVLNAVMALVGLWLMMVGACLFALSLHERWKR